MLLSFETRRLLQSSSFWEARRALIGQLSGALWLAESLKRETDMLRLSPYCDDNNKTHINEAFVASSEDIITDYMTYTVFVHITMTVFNKHYSKLAFESSLANSFNNKTYLQVLHTLQY